MPPVIPPGTALDPAMRERLSALVSLLRASAERMTESLKTMQSAPATARYARAQLRETRAILDGLLALENGTATGAWVEWARGHLPATYGAGVEMAAKDLALQGVTAVPGAARIHMAAVEALLTRYVSDATEIVVQLNVNAARAARVRLAQAGFGDEIAHGIISGEARRTTSKRLRDALRKAASESLPEGVAFDPASITEVEINGRRYALDTWAEMHARTATAEAASAGIKATTIANGVEHVQVTAHAHAPCICTPYEGRIYRLFQDRGDMRFMWIGDTPGQNQGPPFHVNCVHRLAPAVVEYLEERGDVDGRARVPDGIEGMDERDLARWVRANRARLEKYSRDRDGILPEDFRVIQEAA